jgi:hypothetical protein
VDDDALLRLAKDVLDQHFGIRAADTGEPVCATCLTVTWPCPPALLARHTQQEVLSR